MRALVFAAGLGTRLKPLTDTMPKAMVPVGGRPLLQILLEKLRDSGCSRAAVNVHHFASQNNEIGLIRLIETIRPISPIHLYSIDTYLPNHCSGLSLVVSLRS